MCITVEEFEEFAIEDKQRIKTIDRMTHAAILRKSWTDMHTGADLEVADHPGEVLAVEDHTVHPIGQSDRREVGSGCPFPTVGWRFQRVHRGRHLQSAPVSWMCEVWGCETLSPHQASESPFRCMQ